MMSGTSRDARFNRSGDDRQARVEEAIRARALEKAEYDASVADTHRSLATAKSIVGTCQTMCPSYEIAEREFNNTVDRFEMIPDSNPRRFDLDKAVKKYVRSGAGKEEQVPSELRPEPVLKLTLDYLINEILANHSDLSKTQSFLRDRMRAIIQDTTIQHLRGKIAIELHEKITRFHILSLHVMSDTSGFSEQSDWDVLNNYLQSLDQLYNDTRENNIYEATQQVRINAKKKQRLSAQQSSSSSSSSSSSTVNIDQEIKRAAAEAKLKLASPNEPEFRAYHIISHIRDANNYRTVEELPPTIFNTPWVQQALRLQRMAQTSNEINFTYGIPPNVFPAQIRGLEFFRELKSLATPFLMSCLAELSFVTVRRATLYGMHRVVYSSENNKISIKEFRDILGFNTDKDARDFIREFGIDTNIEKDECNIGLRFIDKNDRNKVKLAPYSEPATRPVKTRSVFISEKQGRLSTIDLINGFGDAPVLSELNETQPGSIDGVSHAPTPFSSPPRVPSISLVRRPTATAITANSLGSSMLSGPTSPLGTQQVAPNSATSTKPSLSSMSSMPFGSLVGAAPKQPAPPPLADLMPAWLDSVDLPVYEPTEEESALTDMIMNETRSRTGFSFGALSQTSPSRSRLQQKLASLIAAASAQKQSQPQPQPQPQPPSQPSLPMPGLFKYPSHELQSKESHQQQQPQQKHQHQQKPQKQPPKAPEPAPQAPKPKEKPHLIASESPFGKLISLDRTEPAPLPSKPVFSTPTVPPPASTPVPEPEPELVIPTLDDHTARMYSGPMGISPPTQQNFISFANRHLYRSAAPAAVKPLPAKPEPAARLLRSSIVEATTNDIFNDILGDIIDLVCDDLQSNAFIQSRALDETAAETAPGILGDIVMGVARDIAQDELVSHYQLSHAFNRWKATLESKRRHIREVEQTLRQMRTDLAEMDQGHRPALPPTPAIPAVKQLSNASVTESAISLVDTLSTALTARFNSSEQSSQQLTSRLLVAVKSLDGNDAPSQWLCDQFSQADSLPQTVLGGNDPMKLASVDGFSSLPPLAVSTHDSSSSTLRVSSLGWYSPATQPAPLVVDGVVFQLDPLHPDSLDESNPVSTRYWKQQSSALRGVLDRIDSSAPVPILCIVWPSANVASSALIEAFVRSRLQFVQDGYSGKFSFSYAVILEQPPVEHISNGLASTSYASKMAQCTLSDNTSVEWLVQSGLHAFSRVIHSNSSSIAKLPLLPSRKVLRMIVESLCGCLKSAQVFQQFVYECTTQQLDILSFSDVMSFENDTLRLLDDLFDNGVLTSLPLRLQFITSTFERAVNLVAPYLYEEERSIIATDLWHATTSANQSLSSSNDGSAVSFPAVRLMDRIGTGLITRLGRELLSQSVSHLKLDGHQTLISHALESICIAPLNAAFDIVRDRFQQALDEYRRQSQIRAKKQQQSSMSTSMSASTSTSTPIPTPASTQQALSPKRKRSQLEPTAATTVAATAVIANHHLDVTAATVVNGNGDAVKRIRIEPTVTESDGTNTAVPTNKIMDAVRSLKDLIADTRRSLASPVPSPAHH